jgi:hypothetical protein
LNPLRNDDDDDDDDNVPLYSGGSRSSDRSLRSTAALVMVSAVLEEGSVVVVSIEEGSVVVVSIDGIVMVLASPILRIAMVL